MIFFIFIVAAVVAYLIYKIKYATTKLEDNKMINLKKASEEKDRLHTYKNIDKETLYNYLRFMLSTNFLEIKKKIIGEKLDIEVMANQNNLESLIELADEVRMLHHCNIEELSEYYFNKAERDSKYGKTYNLENYYSKAIDLVKKPIFYNNRGCIYHQRNLFESAISDYTQAINLDPDFGQYYYNRGGAYFTIEKREEARNDWQKASELGIEEAENMLKIHFNNFFI
jgi:tetratricopeptide (TPR) repeat protein